MTDGHIEVAKAYYSVSPEHLGHTLWVRWDLRLVRIFNGRMEQIALHARQEPGRFSTQDKHIAAEKRSGVERGAVYLLSRARLIGGHAARWAENMLQTRGIEGVRVLQGLLSLTHRHDAAAIERACEVAFSHGAWRLRTIPPTPQARRPRAGDVRLPPGASDHSFLERLREAGGHVVRASLGEGPEAPGPSPKPPPPSLFSVFPSINQRKECVAMNESLSSALRKLRLSGLSQTLEVRMQEAASHNLSHAEFLELIFQDELSVRQERLIGRRVKAAAFRELKPLEEFDFSFNPSIKKKQIYDLACCRFIRERRDVLWMGPPGVGKSFLVQALGYQAIKQGFVVLYRSIFVSVRRNTSCVL